MLNEEETDQTGGESLQEAITANGSQLSASTLPLPARTRDGERGKVGEREREREAGRWRQGTEKKGTRGWRR